jgi:hypothetical protein
MSEEELAQSSLLEPGVYPFEVLAASEELSKAGNEMIAIKLTVFGNNGEKIHVFDYLLEKVAFKLRHFCEATGLLTKYENGTLSELDCEAKTGFVKLAIEPGNGGYSPKNTVKDYVVKEKTASAQDMPRKLTPEEFNKKHGIDPTKTFDDDIPF